MTDTLHARAEAWECDFNGHWNTRYYCKAFQMAAAVADQLGGREPASVPQRHLRFHAELHSGDPITIRSFDVTGGEGAMTAHQMFCFDRLVATALDTGVERNAALTVLPLDDATRVLPRGVSGETTEAWTPDPARDLIYELGQVAPEELYSDGTLQPWQAVARMSSGSHHHDLTVGFTLDLMKREGIGRMLAEMRCTALGAVHPGDFLHCVSRMTAASGKAFNTAHMLTTHRGTPVAMFELCTLSVDMTARRAMNLPAFATDWFARLQAGHAE